MTPPETPDLLPCPFCGSKPQWGFTKKTGCQMHGDPIQYVTLSCGKCEFKPGCIGGCRYRGGDKPQYEKEARVEAANKWNTRADLVTRTTSAPSTAAGGGDCANPEPVYQAGKVRAKFVLEAFDETMDDMTVIKDSPSWRTIREALVLLDKTEQQKTAEPDVAYALEWTEGVLSALYDWENDRKSGAPYMDKSDEVRAYETIRSILYAHLTAISTDNAKRGDMPDLSELTDLSACVEWAEDELHRPGPSNVTVPHHTLIALTLAARKALTTTAAISTQRLGDTLAEAIYLLDRACQFKTNDTQESAMKNCIVKLKALTSKPETAGQEREGSDGR